MTEPIKFGMTEYGNSKGFPVRNFSEFSDRAITIDDIFSQLGGMDKLSNEQIDLARSLFDKIAGANGKIEKGELANYFHSLDKAAYDNNEPGVASINGKYYAGKEVLDRDELYNMEAKRGNVEPQKSFLGINYGVDKESRAFLGDFVNALVKVNDKNIVQDKKLAARTSYDKQGNKVIRNADGNGSVTYDKNNKILSKNYTENGRKTVENYQNGRLANTVETQFGTKSVTTYDTAGRKTKTVATGKENWTSNYTYDANGALAKEVTRYGDGRTTTGYYKSGVLSKEVSVDANGEKTEDFYRNYNMVKTVNKDQTGKIKGQTFYSYNANGYKTKEVNKDASGNIIDWTEFSAKRQVTKDANGNITYLENFGANGELKNAISYYKDGSSSVRNYGRHGLTTNIEKDKDGNTTEIEEYRYDAKGREAKITTKDGQGNIERVATITYPTKTLQRKEVRDADGNLQYVDTRNKKSLKTEYYSNNSLIGSQELTFSNLSNTCKNANGDVISENQLEDIKTGHIYIQPRISIDDLPNP